MRISHRRVARLLVFGMTALILAGCNSTPSADPAGRGVNFQAAQTTWGDGSTAKVSQTVVVNQISLLFDDAELSLRESAPGITTAHRSLKVKVPVKAEGGQLPVDVTSRLRFHVTAPPGSTVTVLAGAGGVYERLEITGAENESKEHMIALSGTISADAGLRGTGAYTADVIILADRTAGEGDLLVQIDSLDVAADTLTP